MRRDGRNGRRGSALILALIVVAFVTAFSIAMLRVSDSVTSRQVNSVDDKRAFYLAEAGLSEAYFGLQTGKSGQVGSLQAPALLGDGLVWVDSDWGGEGLVTLRSTGMCESGRSTLELVVRRETNPFGIFADEGIDLEVPFLLDGYDSETSTYFEQAGVAFLSVHDLENWTLAVWHSLDKVVEVFYDDFSVKSFYCDEYDLETWEFFYTHRTDGLRKPRILLTDADAVMSSVETVGSGSPESYDDYTTGGGGQLGSNGPIRLVGGDTDLVTIFGDVVPGEDHQVSLGQGVTVSGVTEARRQDVILPPVTAPDVTMLPGVTHTSLIPMVVPPGEIGYEHLRVGPDAEVVVQGPGDLVVGELVLEDLSLLTIENEAGATNVYVTGSLDFAEGSRVEVESTDTSDLSLQGTPTASEFLLNGSSHFHGMVYAPDAHVRVGRDFEVFGMLASNTLDVAPYARLHFDSGVLGDSGVVPIPRLVGWSIAEIPAEVAQSRVNPFELLGVDRNSLESAADSQQTVSWIAKINYRDAANELQNYEGPFEQFDPSPMSYFAFPIPEFTAPEATLSAPWMVHVRYQKLFGGEGEYTGTVDDFVASLPLMLKFLELNFTPPPELQ